MIRIIDRLEKGHQDRMWPMTPDFASFLRVTPEPRRRGAVFNPLVKTGDITTSVETLKKKIATIGRVADVKVDTQGKVKYASAHDLRRSFGARWAPHVTSLVLKDLMRHSAIETTEKYYVGQNSERIADAVYDAYSRVGSSFGEFFGELPDDPAGASPSEADGKSSCQRT